MFDFEVVHCPGKSIGQADVLLRVLGISLTVSTVQLDFKSITAETLASTQIENCVLAEVRVS